MASFDRVLGLPIVLLGFPFIDTLTVNYRSIGTAGVLYSTGDGQPLTVGNVVAVLLLVWRLRRRLRNS